MKDEKQDIKKKWFNGLTYSIQIKTLQEQGDLSSLRVFAPEAPKGLEKVKLGSNGDFKEDQLESLLTQELHLGSIVNAINEYCVDREHIVVFCVTIKHAEAVEKVLILNNISACSIHSKQKHDIRMENLDFFEGGKIRAICNVGVLTEGWDCTSVDCMIMARPTVSPALYVQMIGRGLRTHENKKDCLLIDLSGNYRRHGNPNDPNVDDEPSAHGGSGGKNEREEHDKKEVICPNCSFVNEPGSIVCDMCDNQLVPANNKNEKLKEIKQCLDLSQNSEVVDVVGQSIYVYKTRAGNMMVRISIQCVSEHAYYPIYVNEFLDIEGQGSRIGFKLAQKKWLDLGGKYPPPTNLKDAEKRFKELKLPKQITIVPNGRFYEVVKWGA